MQAGNHRMLWVGIQDLQLIKKLVTVHAREGGPSVRIRVKDLLDRIQMVLAAFKDHAERLKELEVVCRANSFWLNEPSANLVRQIRKIRKDAKRADKDEELLASPEAKDVREKLEKAGRIKKRDKKLRGGIGQ